MRYDSIILLSNNFTCIKYNTIRCAINTAISNKKSLM